MAIEFHRDGPWELPEGWAWARLEDLCDFIGRGRGPAYVEEGGVAVINQKCVRWGRLDDRYLRQTSRLAFENLPTFLHLRAGDVLWNSTGTGTIGRAVVYDGHLPEVTVDSHVTIVRPRWIDPHYVCSYIETWRIQHQVVEEHVGSTNQQELPRAFVQQLLIPVPPAPEQCRIAARINELFTEIADGETALTRARDDLDTWRRALLKAAVTGELTREWRETNLQNESGNDVIQCIKKAITATVRPLVRRNRKSVEHVEVDLATLPDLPESWAWSRIGDIGEVTGGLTKNPDRTSIAQKLPYLRVANVQYGELDLSEVHQIGVDDSELERVRLRTNDLLVVEGNGSIDQIGRCAIWTNEIDPCVHQNHIIKVRFVEAKLGLWVFHWLMSPHGRQLVTRVASSTSGLHTLSISKIEAIPVPISPAIERDQILGLLRDESDNESTVEAELSDGNRSLLSFRQSILRNDFEGRLVAQDPEDEAAEHLLARLSEQAQRNGRPRRQGKRLGPIGRNSKSVIAGLESAIHAAATPSRAAETRSMPRLSMDARVKPAHDE